MSGTEVLVFNLFFSVVCFASVVVRVSVLFVSIERSLEVRSVIVFFFFFFSLVTRRGSGAAEAELNGLETALMSDGVENDALGDKLRSVSSRWTWIGEK